MAPKTLLSLLVVALLGGWLMAGPGGPGALAAPAAPVVVELFTSQSCSSCPPADALLAEVARHDNVIALGCHVTYWNHLDWRDTLSQPLCSDRQRAYAAAGGTGRVYTPQAVVNGEAEFVGSDRRQMLSNIASPRRAALALTLERKTDSTVTFALPDLENASRDLTVWIAGYRRQFTQNMGAGENSGRTVVYVNPVVAMAPLGTWQGRAKTVQAAIPRAALEADGGGGVAVLVQEGAYGAIVAAGKLEWAGAP